MKMGVVLGSVLLFFAALFFLPVPVPVQAKGKENGEKQESEEEGEVTIRLESEFREGHGRQERDYLFWSCHGGGRSETLKIRGDSKSLTFSRRENVTCSNEYYEDNEDPLNVTPYWIAFRPASNSGTSFVIDHTGVKHLHGSHLVSWSYGWPHWT